MFNLNSFNQQSKIILLSFIIIFFSLLYLIWAIYNSFNLYSNGFIIKSSFDDGILCFPFTLLSGLIGLLSIKYSIIKKNIIFLLFILLSFLWTVIVYLLSALFINNNSRHLSYLIIGSFIWGLYGLYYCNEFNKFRIESDENLLKDPILGKIETSRM